MFQKLVGLFRVSGCRGIAAGQVRGFAALVAWLWLLPAVAAPGLVITNIPVYQTTSDLAGIVFGADPSTCRVAVCTYSSAALWWSKPKCSTQLTPIQIDGRWVADVTTGGTDTNATRFATFLVSSGYSEPCVQGPAYLPTNVFNAALAKAIVTRPSPGVGWLRFSGYDWWIKSSDTPVGPGPNLFSGSSSNVWVDSLGQLHLRITHRSNQWQCAQIISARTFGCGHYRFRLNSSVDTLDARAVLGLFTYSDDPAYSHRELDIECSRWANASDANNSQFAVQPSGTAGHKTRFLVPGAVTNCTLSLTWQTNSITFQALEGAYTPTPAAGRVITNWIYALAVPRSGDETVRLNLWLYQGNAPTDGQEQEVVIQSFEFVPLDTALPATLILAPPPSSQQFRFLMSTQPDFRYQVQSAADLSDWQILATMRATNIVVDFTDTNAVGSAQRFYRTVTLP